MRYRSLMLGMMVLLPLAAEAGPRDDMLAGIARCNAFSDERTFLDCVYGAAQPVRAELGLPPAPPEQTRLVPREMGSAASSRPAAATASIANPAPQPDRGFVDRLLGSNKPLTPSLPMRSYAFDRLGFFAVTLSDGEVWRQDPGDFERAHWNKPAANYVVTVVTGAAGTSNLEVNGESVFYKVRRQR
jgi:hypothetical protein